MAEGGGLEPPRPKPPVFKTGALPITLTLRWAPVRVYRARGGPFQLVRQGNRIDERVFHRHSERMLKIS